MIGAFPDPYQDELLYSVCARFGANMRYPDKRMVPLDLFSTRNAIAVVDLPSHLGDLAARLPPGHSYTVDRWIDEHTLLPLYAPFLPAARRSQLRADMAGHGGQGIHMRAGIMGSAISAPAELRFCAACAVADRQARGEAYWHRGHQVAGAEVCPIHGQPLANSGVSTSNARVRHAFVPAESVIPDPALVLPFILDAEHPLMWQLARDTAWLLENRGQGIDPPARRRLYIRLLADRDFATYQGGCA